MQIKLELNWRSFVALGLATSMAIYVVKSKTEDAGNFLVNLFDKVNTLLEAKKTREIALDD